MRQAGYGPDKPLTFVLSTRDVARYRDVSVMILDLMSKIYVKGELKVYDTAIWCNVVAKHNYSVGVGSRRQSTDDPDVAFYKSFMRNSPGNSGGYCRKEIEAVIERLSASIDPIERKRLVKAIDRKLPIHWQPTVRARPNLRSLSMKLRMLS